MYSLGYVTYQRMMNDKDLLPLCLLGAHTLLLAKPILYYRMSEHKCRNSRSIMALGFHMGSSYCNYSFSYITYSYSIIIITIIIYDV